MRIQTGVTGCSRSSEAATHKKGQFGTLECGARRGGKADFSSARQGNRAALPLTRRTSKATSPFTRRTTSAVSAANECEGITCLWQVTRNDSDEAERSERSPPGVARNAGGEGVGCRRRTSKRQSRAREWECFASQRESRGERGGPDGRSCTPQAGRP